MTSSLANPEIASEESKENQRKKAIRILSILNIYKDIDRRSKRLGRWTPFPDGYEKYSEEKLKTKNLEKLKEIRTWARRLQSQIMSDEIYFGFACVWFCDTSPLEYDVKETWKRFRNGCSRIIEKCIRN